MMILSAPLQAAPPGDTFNPYWDWTAQFSTTRQQAGQNIFGLSFGGTWHLDEAGDYLGFSLQTSRLKVEGVTSTAGSASVNGGLGLGSFSPSLSLSVQGGENALKVLSGNLSLGFQIADPFSVNLSGGGSIGSHQGEAAQLFNLPAGINPTIQIDTKSWYAGLGLSFYPWDGVALFWSVQNSYDITYQVENLARTIRVPYDQNIRVLSFDLGTDITLVRGWTLGLSAQAGNEYYPSGSAYSSNAGGVVESNAAVTYPFLSGTMSLSFSFE
jgi:hypothetical protein